MKNKFISLVIALTLTFLSVFNVYAARLPDARIIFDNITSSSSSDSWNFKRANTTNGVLIVDTTLDKENAYFDIILSGNALTTSQIANFVISVPTVDSAHVKHESNSEITGKTEYSFKTWLYIPRGKTVSFTVRVPNQEEANFTVSVVPHKHSWNETIKRTATPTSDGSKTQECVICGFVNNNVSFPKVNDIKLNKTEYVYSGESLKPSVTVKDSKGNVVNKNNYTLKYKNNKNVGVGSVTVSFQGEKYSGTKELSFTILPKKTTLTKITAQSKGFTAYWNKNTTQTSGYQLQYSTNKDFKSGNKNVKISNNNTTSKKITKLTGNKTYYVRIRTYKVVNNKTYYSSWSASKKITTKK